MKRIDFDKIKFKPTKSNGLYFVQYPYIFFIRKMECSDGRNLFSYDVKDIGKNTIVVKWGFKYETIKSAVNAAYKHLESLKQTPISKDLEKEKKEFS